MTHHWGKYLSQGFGWFAVLPRGCSCLLPFDLLHKLQKKPPVSLTGTNGYLHFYGSLERTDTDTTHIFIRNNFWLLFTIINIESNLVNAVMTSGL